MSFGNRFLNALIAFIYLRLYEFLFGFLILAAVFYFTDSIAIPPDLQGKSRLFFALLGPMGFIAIFYFFFGYFFTSLLAVLILRLTPFFQRTMLALVNALTYAGHGLWVIHLSSKGWPLSVWVAWAIIVIFNYFSPRLLPSRMFMAAQS